MSRIRKEAGNFSADPQIKTIDKKISADYADFRRLTSKLNQSIKISADYDPLIKYYPQITQINADYFYNFIFFNLR